MKKRRRKKKIKWGNVLLIIMFPILIIGGIIMYKNINFKDNTIKEKPNDNILEEPVNKEEIIPKAPLNSSKFKNIKDGEYITTTGHKLIIKDKLAYIEGNLIVNKTYSLPSDYIPKNTYQAISSDRCNNCLDKEVMEQFKLMQSDARSIGLNIYIASGYRSYKYQDGLYNRYINLDGIELADTYSARPGHSEHQTGLCFDLNSVDDSFANTDEGRWVHNNAHNYGFIIRYPKGKEDITGYKYEAWHLRYVGLDLAEKLYNNNEYITLEEYYGLSSIY